MTSIRPLFAAATLIALAAHTMATPAVAGTAQTNTAPIIRPNMDASMGSNIAGPSLIRMPDWTEDPLGQ